MTERAGFGLYVHWPFCQAKCPYCDFNSHVVSGVDQQRWASALTSEIRRYADETGPRVLDSIFFGGGTPSLMTPETVATVIDTARASWLSSNDLEITLEANPTSVEASRFDGYARAGVNRVSIGVQALNDPDLKALGRLHSASEAKVAVDIAKKTFPRVSFDLIYARQNQSLSDWESELEEALEMAADHLSLYQLTIEDGTAFGDRMARGRLRGLPNDDLAADMFELTQAMTADAGLAAYEISNHAKPGAASRHNLIYWHGGDWVGVGPGAHGRLTLDDRRTATEAHSAPGKWLDAVESARNGESLRSVLPKKDAAQERVMMGLRLVEGIEPSVLSAAEISRQSLQKLIDISVLEELDGRVAATATGRAVLNAILRELLT